MTGSGGFRSRHLVSDDLIPVLDQLEARDRTLPVEDIRTAMLEMLAGARVPFSGVRCTERFIDGPDGNDLRLLVYQPEARAHSSGGLLHIHGGGYTVGAPEMAHERNSRIAADLGHVVVSVAYRLAPEAVYPAALEDCYAALAWLHSNAADLNVDRARLGIVGESAGGGHAAAVALLARDRGEVPLSFQWLVYPMIDDRTGSGAAPHPYAGEFVWTADDNKEGWRAMLGQEPGGTPPGPYAVPARVEDLSGLPYTLLQTGSLDLFCEENLDYARRLLRAGVPLEFHVYSNAIHGFTMAKDSRVGSEAAQEGISTLARLWGR